MLLYWSSRINPQWQLCQVKYSPNGKLEVEIGVSKRDGIEFNWLEYNPSGDSAYCFACRFAYSKRKVGCADSAFVRRGFRNWKSAVEDFRTHEQSKSHRSAAEYLTNARSMHKRGDSVAQQLSSAHKRS